MGLLQFWLGKTVVEREQRIEIPPGCGAKHRYRGAPSLRNETVPQFTTTIKLWGTKSNYLRDLAARAEETRRDLPPLNSFARNRVAEKR